MRLTHPEVSDTCYKKLTPNFQKRKWPWYRNVHLLPQGHTAVSGPCLGLVPNYLCVSHFDMVSGTTPFPSPPDQEVAPAHLWPVLLRPHQPQHKSYLEIVHG